MNEMTKLTIIYFIFGISWLLGWPFIMRPILNDFWFMTGFIFYPLFYIIILIKIEYDNHSLRTET